MSTKHSTLEALPVLAYSTGAGWATLGRASTPKAARAIVLRNLSDASLSLVKNFGFEVLVSRRTELQRELSGGPDGYVYSVGKVVAHA